MGCCKTIGDLGYSPPPYSAYEAEYTNSAPPVDQNSQPVQAYVIETQPGGSVVSTAA